MAPVGAIDYVAGSATDDDAVVNGLGRVTAADADLQPLAPIGMEALVLSSTGLRYQLFDKNNNQIATGTYRIAAVPEPASFWLLWSGLSIGSCGMLRRKFKGLPL
ncbi:MAG: hypothetical protein ABI165_14550 [Bryobacteraceae bacterium]